MQNFIDGHPLDSNRASIAPIVSDYIDGRVLAPNTAERHALPAGARFIAFSSSADFYAKFGDSTVTAAVLSGDVTDGTASELNPNVRRIPSTATHVSLISTSACSITMGFWA